MWSGQRGYRSDKIIVLADTGYYTEREKPKHTRGRKKLSRIMAMLLGGIVTIELLIIGAMLLKIDFRSADSVAVILGAAVLYCGVVASLTDK